MTVIPFPGHKWSHCENDNCTGCMLCHGGLALCGTCGGMEGGLPSDCPGEKMDWDTSMAVYEGRRDFVRFVGWVDGASKYSPFDPVTRPAPGIEIDLEGMP